MPAINVKGKDCKIINCDVGGGIDVAQGGSVEIINSYLTHGGVRIGGDARGNNSQICLHGGPALEVELGDLLVLIGTNAANTIAEFDTLNKQ